MVDRITELALAARDGDGRALEAFVRATQPEVWRLCRHLSDRSSADDLTQETYARALRALPAFRGDSSARTWLFAIARRTVADAIRDARRRRRPVHRPDGDAPDPAGAASLEELVRQLADDQRTAFVLTQVLGLRYAEAAEVAGVPMGTIRSRVSRAREVLLRQLGEQTA